MQGVSRALAVAVVVAAGALLGGPSAAFADGGGTWPVIGTPSVAGCGQVTEVPFQDDGSYGVQVSVGCIPDAAPSDNRVTIPITVRDGGRLIAGADLHASGPSWSQFGDLYSAEPVDLWIEDAAGRAIHTFPNPRNCAGAWYCNPIGYEVPSQHMGDAAIDDLSPWTGQTIDVVGHVVENGNGNWSTLAFTVLVDAGNRLPAIIVPADISVPGTSADGNIVTYTASATDPVDPSPTLDCEPASGSRFPIGSTKVTCTATNAAGNWVRRSFEVNVTDTTPPVLQQVPADQTVEATDYGWGWVCCGWVIVIGMRDADLPAFTATATDNFDPHPTVSCRPQSDSTMIAYLHGYWDWYQYQPLGRTEWTCTATDASGNRSEGKSFWVTIADTTPPRLSLPDDITVDPTDKNGAAVSYAASAIDYIGADYPTNYDGTLWEKLTVTCTTPSGSTFPMGTTTVDCSSTDLRGNTAHGSFHVHVRTPAELLDQLAVTVKGVGPGTSFLAKVQSARADAAAGRAASASATLKALENELSAQSGKSISSAQASSLKAAIERIRGVLG